MLKKIVLNKIRKAISKKYGSEPKLIKFITFDGKSVKAQLYLENGFWEVPNAEGMEVLTEAMVKKVNSSIGEGANFDLIEVDINFEQNVMLTKIYYTSANSEKLFTELKENF